MRVLGKAMAGLFLVSTLARADEQKATCVAAYERAQELRRSNDLMTARHELGVCQSTCPRNLSRDCEQWASEIAALIPSISIEVRDTTEDGAVIKEGQVLVDGAKVERSFVELAAGTHVVRFEGNGRFAEETLSLATGEKNRFVRIVVPPVRQTIAPVAKVPALSLPVHDPTPQNTEARIPSYVALGLGGSFLLAGGALALKGHLDRSALKDDCSPNCKASDVDAIRTTWAVAAGFVGVGVVAVGTGILLWPRAKQVSVRIEPTTAGFRASGVF